MCGISGIISINQKPVLEADIRLMMQKMNHRGPDDSGTFIKNHIGLGFVRLSILDLTKAGHQPMFSSNGRYVIVYNGEVYNYIELKKELSHEYEFHSGTDTEVVLAAYQKWGRQCLDKFNGMFAFVIYDTKTNDIFGVRDRFGIKLLYYYLDEDQFIFASEIKSILPLLAERKSNKRIIYDYLIYNRTDHTQQTFFENIFKLQHGSCFSISNSEVTFNRWYNLESKLSNNNITAGQYRELLKDSLKLRLRSDVPVCVSLSGGIDASAIAGSLIKDFGMVDLNTFSAVYGRHEPSDESNFIKEFDHTIKNMHYTYPTADTFFADHEHFIDSHNEPVPDIGPYAQFKVMELASNFVKVTLDGQGADEQLGGYHYFFGSYYVELLRKLKLCKLIMENIAYMKDHRSIKAIKYFVYYLMPEFGQRIVNSRLYPSVNRDFYEYEEASDSLGKMLYNPVSLQDSLVQHFEYKLEHLLRWEDLNSMHFSIESRVPFLDHRLVENTIPLPSSSKLNNGVTKFILREAVKDVVPSKIYSRKDKKGFSNPREKWFRSDKFKELIQDIIHSKQFKERGFFHPKTAQKRYQLHLDEKKDLSKEIWKWINLEIWFNRFID